MTKTKKNEMSAIYFNLSNLLDKKKFSGFNELRKESAELFKDYRELFIKIILSHNDIPYETTMSRREKAELFETNKIEITLDEESNSDKISIDGKLYGQWFHKPLLEFKNGQLICKLEYKIHE